MADIEKPQGKRQKPQIKDHSLWQLETIAQDALKNAESCIQGCRVDIEKLIESKFNIIIDVHYHLQQECGVMAYTLINGKRLFVDDKLMDEMRLTKRYRFTLAEELAHFVIHQNVYGSCRTVDDRVHMEQMLTRQEQWFLETNAKALASAILMPKNLIEERMEQLFSTIGQDTGHTTSIIKILSHDFDVNPQAVKRRLINLGYHKRSSLRLKD